MPHAPYIFTATTPDHSHYSVTINRNEYITIPRGGRDMERAAMIKCLRSLGDEADMIRRQVHVRGVTADDIRAAGFLPHGNMTFVAD